MKQRRAKKLMKRVTHITLGVMLGTSVMVATLSGCGRNSGKGNNEQTDVKQNVGNDNGIEDTKHKIYFKNLYDWEEIYFYLYDYETKQELESWPGIKVTDILQNDGMGNEEPTFFTTVDMKKYNRLVVNDGDQNKTVDIPICPATSGLYPGGMKAGNAFMVYNYGYDKNNTGKIDEVILPYKTTGKTGNYDKKIWIWTPEGYDPDKAGGYKTVYIMDGQNIFDTTHRDSYKGWRANNSVEAMMVNGYEGMIIVGIDNSSGYRDSELTPRIADSVDWDQEEFKELTGNEFNEFVVKTVVPYVQKEYNSSTKREDNQITGASSGGLESFYIGMENPEMFGMVGALSPAFQLFNDEHWNAYLDGLGMDGTRQMPDIYIYNGKIGLENVLYPGASAMYERLKTNSYYTGTVRFIEDEKADHNEDAWSLVFPELMAWFAGCQ